MSYKVGAQPMIVARAGWAPTRVVFPQKTTGKQLGRAYSASWLVVYRVFASIGGVLKIARDWHAHYAPFFMLVRAADEAIRPALVSALADAEAEVARLEAEIGAALPADSKQKLAVAQALDALDDHEAANGWLGMSPEAVEKRLASGDPETVNGFLRETVRVLVAPVGRGRKVPVADRLRVQYLGGGASVDPAVEYRRLSPARFCRSRRRSRISLRRGQPSRPVGRSRSCSRSGRDSLHAVVLGRPCTSRGRLDHEARNHDG
jgi:hypothetical protein